MKLNKSILALAGVALLVGCNSGSGSKADKKFDIGAHSIDECPTNITGDYIQYIDENSFNRKNIIFEKNSEGNYEITNGAGSGALTLIVNGEEQVKKITVDNSEELEFKYTGLCASKKISLNMEAKLADGKTATIKELLYKDSEGNVVSESTSTIDGKTENSKEVWAPSNKSNAKNSDSDSEEDSDIEQNENGDYILIDEESDEL